MFGIGVTEMILIGLVILMLFSPRELPGMMKSVAKVYGSIRRTAEEFRAQVMEADELREPIEEIRAAYHGTKQELMSAQDIARRELQRARAETMKAQQKLSELAREEARRKEPPAPAVATPAVAAAAAAAAPAIASSAPVTTKPPVPASPPIPASPPVPVAPSSSRPPIPGAVASTRPFGPPGASAEPDDPPANDRSSDAA